MPPLELWLLEDVFVIFLARVLSFDVKGQNLKAQPSTSKNVALRAF